jgi:exodeoxyribonuclease III
MVSIATWNINSVRLRAEQVVRFLQEQGPDVLCLQEIKCEEKHFPHAVFEAAGYTHRAVHGQKGYHGVATVSRIPLKELTRNDWQANGEARHVGVELLGPGQGIVLENVYIPAGGDIPDRDQNAKFGQKLDFLERMAVWADTLDRPTLIVGDFNIAPLPEDVYDHKALLKVVSHTPIEIEALTRFADAHRHGSIWGASIYPRRSATGPGGPIAPIGRRRIAGGGSITCGPRPNWPCSRYRTGSSRTPAGGSSRAIMSR